MKVIIGVDPHKLSVTIEVVDDHERVLATGQPTSDTAWDGPRPACFRRHRHRLAAFPMSSRDVIARGATTGGDTGHLVLSGVTVAEILALFGTGAGAFGTGFRIYSLTCGAVVLVSGALTSRQAAKLANGQPTPRMGLYERISIGTWLQWMAVLATILLRERRPFTGS